MIIRILLLLCCLPAVGQDSSGRFPDLPAETLSQAPVVLPQHTQGKYTLLGLAWTRKSEDDLRTWYGPVFNTFIRKGTGMLAALDYDVNVYFVPMFTGINAAAAGPARKAALKNTDPLLQPHILFYRGDMKPYRELLRSEGRDVPFFFVLDKEGNIRYVATGAFSEEKLEAMEAAIDQP